MKLKKLTIIGAVTLAFFGTVTTFTEQNTTTVQARTKLSNKKYVVSKKQQKENYQDYRNHYLSGMGLKKPSKAADKLLHQAAKYTVQDDKQGGFRLLALVAKRDTTIYVYDADQEEAWNLDEEGNPYDKDDNPITYKDLKLRPVKWEKGKRLSLYYPYVEEGEAKVYDKDVYVGELTFSGAAESVSTLEDTIILRAADWKIVQAKVMDYKF